jgi:16S rRNA (adenine1518-N6/adenine1519-N6)-dimethyltransferase
VDSAVVRLTPHEAPLVEDAAGFLKFASACFRQKRKTLRNNLGVLYPKAVVDGLERAELRAEQLSLAELIQMFVRLGG